MTNMQQPSGKTFPDFLNPPLFDKDGESISTSAAAASRPRESVMSQQLAENFESMKKRARSSVDDSSMRELAVETALLVRQEVKRMKDSIAELEALLDQQGEEQVNDSDSFSSEESIGIRPGQEMVMFPRLPEVVHVPEEEMNGAADCTRKE